MRNSKTLSTLRKTMQFSGGYRILITRIERTVTSTLEKRCKMIREDCF